MKDDDSSTKGSEFSAKTQTSSQQKMRLGLGRGRPPKPVPSVSDSGLGPSASSQEPSVGDSQSVTSQVADDYDSRGDKGTFSEVFTDAEEFLTCTEDEQGERELRFSNINCLFFGELQKNALKVYKYSASFEPPLSTKDRHLFLLKISGRIGEYLLSPPDILYAAQPIPENLKVVQETIHGESVKLTLTPSDQPLKLEEFFTCLLKRMSLFLTSKEAYIPLNLLTHEKRFEVYPGDAVDVASERECIVRCSTTFNFNVGKVEDIIEECLIYSAMWGEDQSSYHEIVERNLRDLIVHNELNNKSYVVERILWDENLIICRLLKSDTTHRIQPDKLVLVGTRRVPPTARESIKTDKTMSFLGGPASGQRRQLAMVRYKEMMQQDIPSSYLRKWKLHLKDTAVVSNNVLLQSEVLRMQGDANLISSEGWVNRLSNLRVLVPVRIRNWYVIYEKGDERIVKYMIENLRCDAPTIGIEMSEPRRRAITDTSVASYEAILNSCLSQNEKIELFVVVVRANLTDVYNTVKNWSLSQSRPIATQMVLRDTVKQICSVLDTSLSVITQINCKLGGALWALDKTIDNTVVIGLSTYTSADGKDVLGFVSSRNKLFTQWYSYAIMDIDAELCGQLITAVQKYSVENAGQKPERMIVLSNQIADDDFPTRIIKSANAVFNGKLALIHVEDIERYNEIILGLAEQGKLDEIQETQKKYIFVPQRAEKELDMICCRLDFNNTGLSPKDIAGVIKQLKHVYYNVAGEVNLPAPVLYADRCAEFVADVLKGVQSEKIRDKLYYL